MKMKTKLVAIITLTLIIMSLLCNNSLAKSKNYYKKDSNNNIYDFYGEPQTVNQNSIQQGAKGTVLKVTIYEIGKTITYNLTLDETKSPTDGTYTIDSQYASYGVQTTFTWSSINQDLINWDTDKPILPPKPQNPDIEEFSLDNVFKNANDFINLGQEEQMKEEQIQNISKIIYSTLFILGIIIATIVGAILGIKFITGGLEAKSEVKQLLLPYFIGVVVLFGAFGIWRLVLTILQG